MRIGPYTCVQDYGFSGLPEDIGPFQSWQAAQGWIQRIENRLEREGLSSDWYIRHNGIIYTADGWMVQRAELFPRRK